MQVSRSQSEEHVLVRTGKEYRSDSGVVDSGELPTSDPKVCANNILIYQFAEGEGRRASASPIRWPLQELIAVKTGSIVFKKYWSHAFMWAHYKLLENSCFPVGICHCSCELSQSAQVAALCDVGIMKLDWEIVQDSLNQQQLARL